MKKKFYLPGLYSKSEKKFDFELQEKVYALDKEKTPLLHQFIQNPTDFYKENFSALEKCKRREKRLLEFETPNRAKITHEYDVFSYKKFNFDTYYYLFNPSSRLNWLKIKQEGRRILIANNDEIKRLVKKKLAEELSIYNENTKGQEKFFNSIWKNQKGYPCFIKLEDIKKQDFLIEIEFFDSIKEDKQSNKFCCGLLSPFDERSISYEYEALKGYSSWLYVRAPKDFNISIDKTNPEIELNKEADPDINALTIKDINSTVDILLTISIPPARKLWFKSIYWASLIMIGLLLNNVYIKICKPLFIVDFSLQNIDLRIVLALVAGIITTRGWLITEETILKRYSKYLTRILVLLVVLSIISTI
jgi:hypothetical protein